MKKTLILLGFFLSSIAYAEDYYLDIMSVKGEVDKKVVIFSYRGCVDVLKVDMKDLEQENMLPEGDLRSKGPITKWLISQKKARDAQKQDCKR